MMIINNNKGGDDYDENDIIIVVVVFVFIIEDLRLNIEYSDTTINKGSNVKITFILYNEIKSVYRC